LEALRPAVEAREAKIAVLTDGKNHPGAVADLLRRLGAAGEYVLWVCENLGGLDERVSRHPADRLGGEAFSPLNVVVLVREGAPPSRKRQGEAAVPLLGIPERELQYREGPRGLITRREVRVLVLCHLELRPGDVLWDVGAGSGSVAVEAARLSPELRVFALERDAEVYRYLEANAAALGLGRVRGIHAEAPEGLADLPNPDAVFIGGSGGRLSDILDEAVRRLRPGGRLVLNCVTLETLSSAWEWLRSHGVEPEVTSVQLARSRPLGRLHALEPDHPIFIVRARKP
jgi:precorrin-6Y C5,15-methyltransferase (decarboxylating)